MLGLGICFWMRAPALVEDLELPEHVTKENMDLAYSKAATNCILTGCVYVLTLVFSVWQVWENNNQSRFQGQTSGSGYSQVANDDW
jgi:hypothetical protein